MRSAVSVTGVGVTRVTLLTTKESSSLFDGGHRTDPRPKAVTTICRSYFTSLALTSLLAPPSSPQSHSHSFSDPNDPQLDPCAPFLRLPSPQHPRPVFLSRLSLDILVSARPLTTISNVRSRPHKRYQDLSCVFPPSIIPTSSSETPFCSWVDPLLTLTSFSLILDLHRDHPCLTSLSRPFVLQPSMTPGRLSKSSLQMESPARRETSPTPTARSSETALLASCSKQSSPAALKKEQTSRLRRCCKISGSRCIFVLFLRYTLLPPTLRWFFPSPLILMRRIANFKS